MWPISSTRSLPVSRRCSSRAYTRNGRRSTSRPMSRDGRAIRRRRQWLQHNPQVAAAPDPDALKALFSRFVDERRQASGGATDVAGRKGCALPAISSPGSAARRGEAAQPAQDAGRGDAIGAVDAWQRARPTRCGLTRRAVVAGGLGAGATLCWPASADAADTPKRGGTLEFAVLVEPSNYDCHRNTSFAFLHPIAPHYSTLLKFDAANYPQIVGDLAQSWSVSPDRRTYTFKLRPNVLFHDGSQLTSADVKASYERIIHPPPGVVSARRVDYAAISSIETPDPRTVVFHLEWPEAAMLAEFRLAVELHLQRRQARGGSAISRKRTCSAPGRSSLSSTSRASIGAGRRWEKYFQPGRPYLDGYQADFMTGRPDHDRPTRAAGSWPSSAASRPPQRDELVEALGDRIAGQRKPMAVGAAGRLQHQTRAVRRCAGAARAVARDRPLGRGGEAAGHDLPQICRRLDAAGLEHGDAGGRAGQAAGLSSRHRRGARRSRAASRRGRRPRPEADAPRARHSDAALCRRRSAGRELARDRRHDDPAAA